MATDLLEQIVKLERDADAIGFRWENTDQIMAQIQSECMEVQEHLQQGITTANKLDLEEEVGDLLHAVFSLCVFCQLNPKDTLQKTTAKFERRLNSVKELAAERGLTNLNGYSFEALMQLWDQAKQRVG